MNYFRYLFNSVINSSFIVFSISGREEFFYCFQEFKYNDITADAWSVTCDGNFSNTPANVVTDGVRICLNIDITSLLRNKKE